VRGCVKIVDIEIGFQFPEWRRLNSTSLRRCQLRF
jgi:hypothetical protein